MVLKHTPLPKKENIIELGILKQGMVQIIVFEATFVRT